MTPTAPGHDQRRVHEVEAGHLRSGDGVRTGHQPAIGVFNPPPPNTTYTYDANGTMLTSVVSGVTATIHNDPVYTHRNAA